jgi:PleD family two-component response regulator
VVTFERPPADVEEMVNRSDRLMYEAKEGEKDRFVQAVVKGHETGTS